MAVMTHDLCLSPRSCSRGGRCPGARRDGGLPCSRLHSRFNPAPELARGRTQARRHHTT